MATQEDIGYIYGLTCSCDDLEEIRYVGLTTHVIWKRLRQHMHDVNYSTSPKVSWMKKHTRLRHTIYTQLLGAYPIDQLAEAELAWMKKFDSLGYKLTNSYSGHWFPMSEETRKKIGDGRRGKPHSPEVRERMRAINKRIANNPVVKEKNRQAQLGKKLTDEHKAKISAGTVGRESWCKGKTLSDETKAKMSAVRKGRPKSEETKARMKLAQQARYENPAAREKMREIMMKAMSDPAVRAKISAAKKGQPNKGMHTRWHVNRGLTSDSCVFCAADQKVGSNG